MFITFKETLSWMYDLGPVARRSVAVLGTGPVGLCFTRIAKFLGAVPVIAVGRRDEALARAVALGADETVNTTRDSLAAEVRNLTSGHGADFIIEAVGDTQLMRQALPALADDGQLAVYGVPTETAALVERTGMPSNWQLRYLRPREESVHEQALDLLRLGFMDLRPFVTHVLPFGELREALELVRRREALKVSLTF
jgi:threonine dehydrogenase-like Zn-dependent dehydrogenase